MEYSSFRIFKNLTGFDILAKFSSINWTDLLIVSCCRIARTDIGNGHIDVKVMQILQSVLLKARSN